MAKWLCVPVLLVFGLAVVSCGSDPDSSASGETVKIEMRDIAFSPTTVAVPAGEPITFEFENVGKVDHEAIIGDQAAQDEHEAEMSKDGMDEDSAETSTSMGGMDDHGAEMDTEALTLKPGATGELKHEFAASDDDILIGCHEPDHFDAGMKIKVSVES